MTRVGALFLLAILIGCAPAPPPLPSGPWHALNAGEWAATPAELQALPK